MSEERESIITEFQMVCGNASSRIALMKSTAVMAGSLSGLLSGFLCDKIGRRDTLWYLTLLTIFSYLISYCMFDI